ncbi:MAG: hypothetical protein HOW73_12675 [Polyangiaceae bacterium]|nr:hypothetical protein [Polyangiaceae bacterium]
MLPFLLPFALAVFAFVAVALVLFLLCYRMVRPGTALIIDRPNGDRLVLLSGGRLLFPGTKVQSVDLVDRTVAYEFVGPGAIAFRNGVTPVALALTLRPPADQATVLALSSMGVTDGGETGALEKRFEAEVRHRFDAFAREVESAAACEGKLGSELADALAPATEPFSIESARVAAR